MDCNELCNIDGNEPGEIDDAGRDETNDDGIDKKLLSVPFDFCSKFDFNILLQFEKCLFLPAK